MYDKILIAPFDYSGNPSRPYRENGWLVIQVDIKLGLDFLSFDIESLFKQHPNAVYGIIAPIPCTAYALSGNRHKGSEARKPIFEVSQLLVAKLKTIVDYLKDKGRLLFWQLENPSTDIHTHNKWLGKPLQKFDPADFAGYLNHDPIKLAQFERLRGKEDKLTKVDYAIINDINAYNKQTWLFGEFNIIPVKRIEPVNGDNPGWVLYGGKSEKTKELRSITPLGFAYAFYLANH